MLINVNKITNYLQSIQTASEILYKQLPPHKRKEYKQYLLSIIHRVHFIATTLETEL